ncbi:MAG: DUF2079 domain-containing protein [Candidatus Levybacteria bacterium]|nr:DUF2079 domain-containing protein [Candidatus Levybacteria bacterium]
MQRILTLIAKRYDFYAWVIFAVFTLASILVSLNRFWQYETFYYDFGIFDRAIWLASRFEAPIIDHLVVGGKIIFADHFNPSIFIFSPLFWITNESEILLVAQSVIVGLSGLYIYKIGKIVTKNSLFSLSVLISYYLFVGLQNALISDFHETTVSTLFAALCFYFFLKNKKFWALFFFLIVLGFKESNFLFGIGLSIVFFLSNKSWRKFSIFLAILSIFWGIMVIKFIIPYFSGGIYGYGVEFTADKLNLIDGLFGNSAKRSTVFHSLWSFSFLSILSPFFWFLIIQDFLVRFFSNRISLGLHYSALLSVILAISSLYSFSVLRKIKIIQNNMSIISLLVICNAIFIYRFILHGPLSLSYNKIFYAHTKDFQFLDNLVSQIPPYVTVMTQNNLASHFTHQKDIWVLKDNYESYEPEYIVLDFRTGQSANNFFPTKNPALILKRLIYDKNYLSIYDNSNQYIFKRKSRDQ